MDIVRFQEHHIKELDIPNDEKSAFLNYCDLYLKEDVSPAFTVKVAGMVQGMAGIRLISRDVGEAWVCFNHEFLLQHKKVIITKIKNYIDFIGIIFKLKRIQAIIDSSGNTDKRFIEFLGLRYEKKLETGWDVYSIKVKGV